MFSVYKSDEKTQLLGNYYRSFFLIISIYFMSAFFPSLTSSLSQLTWDLFQTFNHSAYGQNTEWN